MRDPDQQYLRAEREARDSSRYGDISGDMTNGLNYRDLTLKEEVGEALAFHEDIDASQIEVVAQNGVITLTGEVSSEREMLEAIDRASDVDGVITVMNSLVVHPL